MKSKLKLLIPLAAGLVFMTGCVQKTEISMKVPGDINVKGVHKIAILDFDTVKSDSEAGVFAADKDLLKLAKYNVVNSFYEEPFYSFSDLEIEKNIKKVDIKSKIKDRFDGLLYGKLWWQITPEYHNVIPSKKRLETYTIRKYQCGATKKGKPSYCFAHLTTRTEEKPFNMTYRVVNATLMMSLDFYKVSQNGKLKKITEIFEISKGKFEIKNGKYGETVSLIGEKEKLDKIKVLSKKEDKGFLSSVFEKKSEKVNSDLKVVNNIDTIPSKYGAEERALSKIINKFRKMIAPTKQKFEVKIAKGDNKVEKLFDYSAFHAISTYIVENRLAQGHKEFFEGYNDVDFLDTTKKMLSYLDKKNFDMRNAKNKKKETYKPLSDKELTEDAMDYLRTNKDVIYNYALATEAIGNFEKSLSIYRFLFYKIDNKNQDYANGIGRALLALDMGDKINEEHTNKLEAKKKNSL